MKKNIFFAMLAAAALVSCSSEDLVEDVVEEQTPIGFSEVLNNATRAEITNEDDLATAGGFVVWGYKATTASPMDWTSATTVFNKVSVTPKVAGEGTYIDPTDPTDETAWTYTTKRYWDKNCTYAFYAAAPLQPTDVTYSVSGDANANMISITPVSYGKASATGTYDYLIDRDGNIGRTGATDTWKNVDFDFHHIMTKVDFAVKRSTDVDDDLTITSLTMTGWSKNTGSFTQNSTTTPSTLSNDEWTKPTDKGGSVTLVGTGAGDASVELTSDAATTLTDAYIMVPQDIAASTLTFTVTYTINGETFSNQVAAVAAAQTWGTDSHITYTITVGPKAIEFDVKSVCGWDVTGSGAAATN